MLFGISIFKIFVTLISVSFIFVELKKIYKNKTKISILKAIVSIILWCIIIIFSISPETAHWVSIKFGLGQNLNTLIFIGFVLVFAVILNLIKKIDRLNGSLSDTIRAIALKDLEK